MDRLSSALTIKEDPVVSWDCAGQNDTVIDPENYTLTTTDDDPGRIPANESSDPIFPDKNSGAGTHFVTIDLWNSGTADDFVAATQSCLAGLNINVKLVAAVSSEGDTAAGGAGTLQNTVNVDVYDGTKGGPNPDGPAKVDTASGGFDFVKTEKNPAIGLPNATFRLANLSDPTQFLLTDGTFANAENKPLKAFVTATSNSKGIVTFAGLPLFKASDYRTDANGNSVLDGTTEVDSPWMSTDTGSGGS